MSRRTSRILLPLIYLGYISLGLPDGTLGVAWPRMSADLHQPLKAAGIIMVMATLLSATASFSSGRIIARLGTGPVVMMSCLLTCSALLVTSQTQSFALLVAAALPLGLGAGAVDAALNGFVARHYSGRHMNWLHACWGIGASSGPLIMTHALGTAHGWRGGYLLIGSLQLGLTLLFAATLGRWKIAPDRVSTGTGDPESKHRSAGTCAANSETGYLSALVFLLYVATEMTAGLWANSILVLGRGIPQSAAGLCVSALYVAITCGRIANGIVVDRWGNRRLVTIGACVALAGAALFSIAHSAPVAGAALALMGLGFAPIYPGLMHEVPRRFAPGAISTVIGIQSGAGCLGAALFPAAAGLMSAKAGLESITIAIVAGTVLLIAIIRRLDRIS